MIPRCDIETHRSTCVYESVPCKYAAVGCEEKPLRKAIKTHEENDQLHFCITREKVLELTKELTEVKSHLLMPRTSTFKLTNYQQLKNEKKAFCSPPFYTSHSGYKMCLEVYANGCDTGAGTHISAYAYLMKGGHDDTLTWPFTGRVTVELLNQLEDKNHHKMTITFLADHDVSKRVVDCEKPAIGYGRPKFISHDALNYNATTNTQYLKNDTLVFRVSVKVPDHKPWLD